MGQKFSSIHAKCSSDKSKDSDLDSDDKVIIEPTVEKSLVTMESLHKSTHDIFPDVFEGFKSVMNVGLKQRFCVTNSFTFGTSDKLSGYKLGATYVGQNKVSETEMYPFMMGEISPNGNMNAHLVHKVAKHLNIKYNGQLKMNQVDQHQMTFEYKPPNLNLCLSVVNPSIANQEILVVCDMMRKMTSRISLGTMLLLQRSKQGQVSKFALWNIGGEYTGDGWSSTLSFRPFQTSLHCTYLKKIPNTTVQIGTELEASLASRQCVATAGYQFHSSTGSMIKSQIDSNWKIASSYEFKTEHLPCSVNLCINGDLWKSVYGLGIGFTFA